MAKKKEVVAAEEEVIPGTTPENEPENLDTEGQPLDQSDPFKVGDTAYLLIGDNSTKVEITYPENENGCFECKVPAYYRWRTSKKQKTVAIHASRISSTQVGNLKTVLALSNSSVKALATAAK